MSGKGLERLRPWAFPSLRVTRAGPRLLYIIATVAEPTFPQPAVESPHSLRHHPWLALGALLLLLCVVVSVWVSVDRRPPEWDHANHLERAVGCYRILSEPGHDRMREILEASSFYPPVVPCAAGLLYFLFPIAPLTAQAVMLAFVALGLGATFALGRRLFDVETGLLAAFLFGTAPFVVFSLTNFQLDLPLAAMVALALYVLVGSEGFSRPGWCTAFGVVAGLGMVTKPPFAGYVLPAAGWALWQAIRAADRKRRLGWFALSLAIAAAIALPWYGPRLLGMPLQIANRSFKFAAQEAQAAYLSAESLLYYPLALPSQLGPVTSLLFVWGILAAWRFRESRAFLWLAGVAPFALFSLIQNRNLRYTLPVLPVAALIAAVGVRSIRLPWRAVCAWVCVIIGLLQVSMAAFAFPTPPRISGLPFSLVIYQPPSRADWRHEAVIADLLRLSAGRPAKVAVVPNYNFFSVSNFRYDAERRHLPFTMVRPWSGPPFSIDFVILKSGSQGPSWSIAKSERITRAMEGGDPYLSAIFPVVGTYPLPDGSVASLRQRRIPPLDGISPARVAALLAEAPAALLKANLRDPIGLRVTLDYRPDEILRGEVGRARVTADSAVIGELDRRDRAPLRLHDIQLVVERLLFNPRRLVETGELEILDFGSIAIERAVLTQADLDQFLRGQPAGTGVTVRLEAGRADVRVNRLGPTIEAQVRLVARPAGRPLALGIDGVRVGGVAVPQFLTEWIVRHFDPTLALEGLQEPVTIASIRIMPGRIEIGS